MPVPLIRSIKRLRQRHRKMVELYLGGDHTVKDIADIMGVTPQTVSNVTNSPLFQDEVSRRRERIEKKSDDDIVNSVSDARAHLTQKSTEAAQTLGRLLTSENEALQVRAADSILDRVGLGRPREAATPAGNITIQTESLQVLQLALKESRDFRKIDVNVKEDVA